MRRDAEIGAVVVVAVGWVSGEASWVGVGRKDGWMVHGTCAISHMHDSIPRMHFSIGTIGYV
jgi:hypothetical protein